MTDLATELHPHWSGDHSECNPKRCPDLPIPPPDPDKPPRKRPGIAPWRVRLRTFTIVHEAAAALRFVGMRDRLRCPACFAVGTWKPHGFWSARRSGDRPVARWLCKCCGRYEGPEGVWTGWVCPVAGVWRLPRPVDPTAPEDLPATPKQLLKAAKVWPWVG